MKGRNIASERVRIGYSQAQVAEAIGVSANTISNWEVGKFEPTGAKLKALSDLFGCTTDYLLGMADDRHGVVGVKQ